MHQAIVVNKDHIKNPESKRMFELLTLSKAERSLLYPYVKTFILGRCWEMLLLFIVLCLLRKHGKQNFTHRLSVCSSVRNWLRGYNLRTTCRVSRNLQMNCMGYTDKTYWFSVHQVKGQGHANLVKYIYIFIQIWLYDGVH